MTNGFGTVWSSALDRLAEVGSSSFKARRTSSKNWSNGLFFAWLFILCVFFAPTAHTSPVLLAASQPASLILLQHISAVTARGSQPVHLFITPTNTRYVKMQLGPLMLSFCLLSHFNFVGLINCIFRVLCKKNYQMGVNNYSFVYMEADSFMLQTLS